MALRPRTAHRLAVAFAAVTIMAVLSAALQGADVVTAQYDTNRTSWNSIETILNTSNVNATLFGKLFTRSLDGWVYAQPLYLQSLPIPGHGTPNVVFVCTANNTVYAFDADSAAISTPYWSTNLGAPDTTPSSATSPNSEPSLGIISTPVIVRSSSALYVTAATRENGHRVYRLHALNIATGQEMPNSPVVIAGQVAGTASDAQNGVLTFDPDFHLQRAGLAVAGGSVYMEMAGSRDIEPFHGWVFGYNLTTLAQTAILNLTSAGMEGGVWQSMRAPVVDSNGNLYVETGNGDYDGAANFSNSVVRLSPTSQGLTVADWFTPDNWQFLTGNDLDLSSAGPMLVPGTNSLIAAGKDGTVYVLNSANMGWLQTGNGQIPQLLQVTSPCNANTCDYTNDPIFWNNSSSPKLYVWPWNDVLRAFNWTGTQLSSTPASVNSVVSNYPGGELTGSSNGSVPGTGIVWALTGDNESVQAATLSAYDASNVANQLWSSNINASRDAAGLFAKNLPPLVANGKVYVGNFSSQLIVYGLLSVAQTPTITWPAPAAITFGGALSSVQLNATANVPGTFVYNPPAGTVLPVGNGQALYATFTPNDTTDYTSTTASTSINVNPAPLPAAPANLVVTKVLNRSGGNIVVQLTIANTGGTAAANVTLTTVKVGTTTATPLPQALGKIAAGGSIAATVTVAGTTGASGAASTLSVSGSYTGGSFSSTARITLP